MGEPLIFSRLTHPMLKKSFLFLALVQISWAEKPIDFNTDIRPILSDKCFFCHGPDSHEREADLRLDIPDGEDGAFADLGGYSAIVPGKPEDSEFILRINDKEDPMPPEKSHKSLKPEEIKLLTRWIAEGAKYSAPWAYTPPVKNPVPKIDQTDWPENWIDRFVFHKLGTEGLKPSPDADPVTLIRRLYFDLTGLPPTPEEVDAFVSRKKSLEKVVDELLASPHFGERMAMYWLDLVRYADTVGYHGDQDHNISPYRDYVIRAFNQNLPFDQFTREQLAGDLLKNPGKWQKVASGYNRLLQTTHEGGLQKKEYDAIYAADRVRNVSAVWMGATVGCAQCHDHKYDPYTIKDHYAMAAFFSDLHDTGFNGNSLPTSRPPEMKFYSDEDETKLARIEKEMGALIGGGEVINTLKKDAEIAKLKANKKRKSADDKKLAQLEKSFEQIVSSLKKDKWVKLLTEKNAIEKGGRWTMITSAKPHREMRVLPRGNWLDDSGPVVTAAIPEFLGKVSTAKHATRLDLANWLTDPKNGSGGLTARVFANRFWYLYFGSGISRSLSDFGGQGAPPSNGPLLDNLAVAFYESGWDVKALVRLLVTSRAYRQSSLCPPELMERDPYNQLVARQSRYRLPAEVIRDNALALSQLLVDDLGGSSAKPYQPTGYYRHLNFPTRKYKHHTDPKQWRRGVYVHWQRQFLHPMLKAMDAPSREECTAERPRSNTPTAALVLLNDPTFIEAARALAYRIMKEGDAATNSRLDFAYQLVLSRLPDAEERAVMTGLLKATYEDSQKNHKSAETVLDVGQAPRPNDVDATELASWTAVARALLNLNETITRN